MSDDRVPSSTSIAFEPAVLDEKSQYAVPDVATESETIFSIENEAQLSRRVIWKCDLRLVPILGSLYFTAFLDRINIANAKLEGFEKELQMPSNGYNMSLWIFFLLCFLSRHSTYF
jgi:hypothetical protein